MYIPYGSYILTKCPKGKCSDKLEDIFIASSTALEWIKKSWYQAIANFLKHTIVFSYHSVIVDFSDIDSLFNVNNVVFF